MATLTISPVIPVPLTAPLGGTGIANPSTSNLTLTGRPALSDTTLGGIVYQGAVGGSTFNVAAGKSFIVDNTLTLAGTDATTMTFPATSTTVAGLSIAQTFSVPQIISTSTNATSLTVTNNTITTGGTGIVNITSTSVTGGAGGVMLYLEHSTSAFTNPAIYVRMAIASGTFTGEHILCSINDVNKFVVSASGATSMAGSLTITGGTTMAIDASSSGLTYLFKTASAMEAAVSTGTGTIKMTGSANVNSAGFIEFQDHAGNTHLIPYF
jgi:hypothetical protein